ncbi:MAG: dTDP-4-dehydrorhamnose reductase [Oscillospiraceae bacterium]
MRILITGCRGQLGSELQKQLAAGHSEIGELPNCYESADVTAVDIDSFDLSDKDAVTRCLSEGSFDIAINCAAYTNVNGCESHADAAFAANALAVRNLAEACEKTDTKLAHVSTDYVFPGDASEPYREYDLPSPVTVYGKTKLAGERSASERCRRHFIIRTAWLYGYCGNNFVRTIIKNAREKGELKVVNDQLGNPTSAADLAHHILKIASGNIYGTYHCTNNGICSWYDFASEIVRLAKIDCAVLPCTTAEYPTPAHRPAFSALDNMMLRLTVGDEMREWQTALAEFISNIDG